MKVLITALGGDIAQGVASILRMTYPDIFIVGTDISDKNAGSHFADSFHIVPPASDPKYFSFIASLVQQHDIEFFFPISEYELGALLDQDLSSLGTCIIWPGRQSLNYGLDKLKTNELLGNFHIPSPWTISSDTAQLPFNYPCICKPRFGSGSKSISIINTKSDALRVLAESNDFIFQELLLPPENELTCCIFQSKDFRSCILLQRRLSGGLTGWAKVIEHTEAQEQCFKIAEVLSLQGSLNIQMRITEAGPRIFEINPRFSSTALIRHMLGFQDVIWSIKSKLGDDLVYHPPMVGKAAARIHSAVLL